MLVALGPAVELHRGVHGSLTASPPSGVRYVDADHRHRFLVSPTPGPAPADPFAGHTLMEVVRYDLPPPVLGVVGVHSSRLPVDGGIPFVVDTDDLVLTLLHGRPVVRGGTPLLPPDHPLVRRRAGLMLGAYLSPSCRGVLFRTSRARDAALDLALDVGGSAAQATLQARSRVVRPAVEPGPPPRPASVAEDRPPHVAFVAAGWTDKGGPEAAQVVEHLARRHGTTVRLSWVGPCPEPWRHRLGHTVMHERLDRDDVLRLLAETDVLLAPSQFESFGMVLVEALAHGAVPVTSSGPGMEHVTELVRHGVDGFLVRTDLPQQERVAQLLEHVEALVDRPSLRTALQREGWGRASTGSLSLRQRDATLLEVYASMAAVRAPRVGPDVRGGEQWVELTPDEMAKAYHRYSAGPRRRRVVQT